MPASRRPQRFLRRADERRAQAIARQGAYDVLTPLQKLGSLNKRLGDGLGAVKQRKRLQEAVDTQLRAAVEASNAVVEAKKASKGKKK